MADSIAYIVIPFVLGKRGKLSAGQAQSFKTRELAVKAAERIAATRAGAVAIEQSGDAEADIYGEPKLIMRYGQVPEEFVEQLAA